MTEVQDDSPAARAGLKRFQVIRQVEQDARFRLRAEFARAVAELKGAVTLLNRPGTRSPCENDGTARFRVAAALPVLHNVERSAARAALPVRATVPFAVESQNVADGGLKAL